VTRIPSIALGLLAVLVPLGCRRESDPPPRFFGQGGKLPPIRVRARVGADSILGPAAGSDEPVSPRGGGGDETSEGPVVIDDSTPAGVVGTYVAMAAGGHVGQLAEILVPEQQEPARQIVAAFGPLIKAQAELDRVCEERFGHAIRLDESGGGKMRLDLVKRFKIVEINEDQGRATLAEQDNESVTMTLGLQQVDGRWRVKDPQLPSEAAEPAMMTPMLEAYSKMADAMRAVAARIEGGELADDEAAAQALQQAVFKAMGMDKMLDAMGEEIGAALEESMSAEGEGESDEEAEPAPAKPSTSEREPVDEVISSPLLPR